MRGYSSLTWRAPYFLPGFFGIECLRDSSSMTIFAGEFTFDSMCGMLSIAVVAAVVVVDAMLVVVAAVVVSIVGGVANAMLLWYMGIAKIGYFSVKMYATLLFEIV